MQRLLSITLLFVSGLISCTKDNAHAPISGIYFEESPVRGRSQLNFISANTVIKSESGSNYSDTYSYSIVNDTIFLKHVWSENEPAEEFFFQRVDEQTIKIQNLYPSIPEQPVTFMIFKKQH